jgi:hypothetical protein
MATDKKNRASAVRFSFPAAIGRMDPGEGRHTRPAPSDTIRAALAVVLK